MLRFISKLNDELKDQLFILCSATSRYLATITAQLMLQNVVPNSFVTPEGRISRLMEAGRIHFLKLFRQKFDNRRANQNLSAAAACRIYRRRRRTGGGAHVCEEQVLQSYAPLASVFAILIVTIDPRAAALEQLHDSTISR